MNKVKVGVCGFARSQDIIFSNLRLLEVQTTFYKPIRKSTAKKWRLRAPGDFEFTLKAWQLITHDATSPTYRKAKLKIEAQEINEYGSFRPTDKVFEAWEVTNEIRKVLDAKIVVFQCPASFRETEENITNMRDFFNSLDRENIKMVWEPRGRWDENKIREVCEDLDLIHGVDPFAKDPVTPDFAYFRLHGSPPGKRMYRYTYTQEDLKRLHNKCMEFSDVYVLFNNYSMHEDSLRFMKMMR